ncbi:hypothetical protein KA013_02435 [Patescibacteria group bacterium]|nr:hypothetical protein [Patescibacteria group bacterium]
MKPKLSIREILHSDGIYLDAMRRRLRLDYFDYRSDKACTMNFEEFMLAIDRYIPEIDVISDTYQKVEQNHFSDRLREKSIKKINALEKEIQDA